jgi:uncharacterized membrane protein
MLTAILIIGAVLAWFAGAVLTVYGGVKACEKICSACFAEEQSEVDE